jgi:hypothetical protein
MLRPKLSLVLALLLIGPSTLSADLIIGNLPATADTTLTAQVNNLRLKAIRFTMGNEAMQVTDLTLRLTNYDVTGEVIAQIRDFTGSTLNPGTNVLLNFNAPTPGGAGTIEYLFSPSSTFTLQANTSYWLFVGGVAGGNFDWRATTTQNYVGPAVYGSGSFTTNGGTSWSNSASRNYFELNGTAPIPEPGSLLLLGVIGCCLGFSRRRR